MPGTDLRAKKETLVTSFAHVIAQGWPNQTGKKRRDSVLKADSPSIEKHSMLSLCTGKVGSCVTQKLQKLVRELPDQRLRERAMIMLDKICALDDYPVVLNHGDLIPSNILVDEQTWKITGLVDWAEAEHLPFGTCLYGLEHLLGQTEAKLSTEQILAELKKLTTPGTSQNPIVLLEDSPSKRTQEPLKSPSEVEPHLFQHRHSKLYTYAAPRPALAPRPANGDTFTGHPGHDMFRMRAAKVATTGWHASVSQQERQDLPFATRHLASQPAGIQYIPARPSVPYFPHPPPAYSQYAVTKPLNEEYLRSKALQYIREYSRSSPRKRKIADDPDETSDSDSTEVDTAVEPTLRKSPFKSGGGSHARFKNGPVTILPDPSFQLTFLVEQASLLTSLLRVYPRSTHQKGLRDDIAMLASVQNQHLADWLNFEVGQFRKIASPHTPRVSRDLVTSPSKPVPRLPSAAGLAETERKQEQDDQVRGFLSADAKENASKVTSEVVAPVDAMAFLTPKDETQTASSPMQRPSSRVLRKLLPKIARVTSSPAVRTSGRKRVAPARFRTE
ncbi:hypothetical protein E8E11_004357 [Didymella keratinophila]|nr:hypothetical protein E8E11_004357 [Didymella keratinophila]